MHDAIRQQGACYNPKQLIIDRVMEDKLNTLEIMNAKLKKENIRLKIENEQLVEENINRETESINSTLIK